MTTQLELVLRGVAGRRAAGAKLDACPCDVGHGSVALVPELDANREIGEADLEETSGLRIGDIAIEQRHGVVGVRAFDERAERRRVELASARKRPGLVEELEVALELALDVRPRERDARQGRPSGRSPRGPRDDELRRGGLAR